ncbi:hypothetical protein [Allorhodopirellula heiligendammensis]|uniref:Uncharacterized protein n=1 Tax=Allorhodopirellula heiligendammensis TaxID=2714739 RepID=A0A5C6BJA4_9BACT|nr:hypothetical protein [Allorhodopirellula heiligendammensis]TWU10524.1 hypothetical protein Poly21_44290 [Allorhodopirellula heiligendammensis]
MDELDPISMYELCFPGAVTGETEVTCPHCEELLTLNVDDPMGTYECRCCECNGAFTVDLSKQSVHWIPKE